MQADEVPDWLRPVVPVCEALAALLAPYGEIAAHDLSTDRIVGLWHPISGRSVGDAALLAELPAEIGDAAAIGPYEKVLPDGRRITSVSAVLSDHEGTRRGLLCINMDRSPLDEIATRAAQLLSATHARPEALFARDWREQIGLRVREFRQEHGLPSGSIRPNLRRELLAALDADGLFAVRGAAELVAEALEVSRATVYNQLKEIRS
ncbi:helix-turn-helix transcriptional regulator [Sciscionella sediminilitoris]|uniref:helix-turn-helix transcriptional regulator n=1 Tax=Sciscionella sediminilitoris TaxID=1445613 RepID=UPI0004DEDA5A|nr:PAS domain-containing protein [Sciscionella sp. SE31]